VPKTKTKKQPKEEPVRRPHRRPSVSILPAPLERALHSRPVLILEGVFVLGFISLWFSFSVLTVFAQPAEPGIFAVGPAPRPGVTTARHLDGVAVKRGAENKWPIGVMIENVPAVRPQAGLSRASVVFEAPAEAGVTRFLAFFDGTEDLERIGPVRSARHYFVDWAEGFDAVYAHAGGSPQAIAQLRRDNVQGANAIGSMARFFFRDRAIPAPHNLFTTSAQLSGIRRVKELDERVPTYAPWKFSPEKTLAERGTPAQDAVVEFSSASYRVEWRYDRAANRYVRLNAGVVQTDVASGETLTAANVAVIRVGPVEWLGEKGRISFPTVGSGDATLLRDGTVTTGTWRKDASRGMLRLFSADGTELAFAPGTTWVEALPTGQPLTY
jgi:hypothetical protein